MKNQFKIVLTFVVSFIFSLFSQAADVFMTGSDGFGTSSLTSAGKWSDGQLPNAANNYFSSIYFVRTPGGSDNATFAGNSLTLQPPSGQGNPMRSIIIKGSGTYTINNLTNAGGVINCGNGNTLATFAGNAFTIASNSLISADQGPIAFNYPLFGSATLTNNGGGGRTITYQGDNTGFTGSFVVTDVRVELTSASGGFGNPASATPNQITLGTGGVLVDSAGITFNNSNGGITLIGNGQIDAASTTTIGVAITDSGGGFSFTAGGAGTVVLNNALNSYSGGTVVSGGTLRIGVAGALPVGSITDNGVLDLNGLNATIDALSGVGSVDTYIGGTPTLTVGANGGSGSLSGSINNSAGTLSLTKTGAGTQTLAGGYTYSGTTLVMEGVLELSTSTGTVPIAPGDLTINSGATLGVNAVSGNVLPADNIAVGVGATLNLSPNASANGINANGGLTIQNNGAIHLAYGAIAGNPTAAAINLSGSLATLGTNITIDVSGVGFSVGTFTLIDYTGTPLSTISNLVLTTTPGVFASLANNTANTSIDLNITAVSKQLSWYGDSGTDWNYTTANWKDASMVVTAYQQYTNGLQIAGDGVRFDDTLFNDFINPPPTNINVTGSFSPFPFTVDSTYPYSLGGSGGISGSTSIVKTNVGSLTLLTSNSFTGGVFINQGSVVVTNDSALGAAGVGVTLNGGTLAFAGSTISSRPITTTVASSISVDSNVTAEANGSINAVGTLTKTGGGTLTLGGSSSLKGALSVSAGTLSVNGGTLTASGNPSYVGYLNGSGALALDGSSTLDSSGELRVGGSDQSGAAFAATGTFSVSSGNSYLSAITLARGNNFENACFGTMTVSGGTVWCTNDYLAGYAGTGTGTLNISGSGTLNIGPAATKWFQLGRWDTSGSSVTVSGGNLNLMNNTSIKYSPGNGSTSGTNVFTLSGTGVVTYYSDAGVTVGGTGDLNLAQSGSSSANNTFNLDGGTLIVPRVASASSTPRRVFNFNGGTLKATGDSTSFMNLGTGNVVANVRNGGAIVDDGGFSITIAQSLVHSTIGGDNATDGGLTKNGTGTVSLSGANTYNGSTTVNAGSLLTTTATSLAGGATVADNATLSIAQAGSATNSMANLTLNGGGAIPGAKLGLGLTAANNPSVPLVNCATLTLNGANTISLAGSVNVGTIALIKYTGAIAGSGSITNVILPQGATGFISNGVASSTIYAVITSTGPGLVWDGGANNLWDVDSSTNWLLAATPTTYQQTIIPGDSVTFNDSGSGTVLLNVAAGPSSLLITNSGTTYTFSGAGTITGPTGIQKQGSGTAALNLTNNSYSGDTIVSAGTLVLGAAGAISPTAGGLIVDAGATLKLGGNSVTARELTGAGVVDNDGGIDQVLTLGGAAGGTWNGTITNTGGGGVSLVKNGSGTWVLTGANHLNNGQSFTYKNQIGQGTVVLTNGSQLSMAFLELRIGSSAGQSGSVVVDGGMLVVTNNVLSIGFGSETATGTLTVNSGTVDHSGYSAGSFAAVANSIDVGAQGSTGTLIINGGQVLNDQPLFLGDGATANGTLRLNGGLLRASVVQPNATPLSSIAYFNGGTLQAATNSLDFIVSGTTPYVQSGGLVLDDGGWMVSLATQGLLEDPGSPGGGVTKTGSGTVYLDAANTYTGTTIVSNGTLSGIGSISAPVVVAPTGNIGAGYPGAVAGGMLTVNGNLTLQGAATFRIAKDAGFPVNDQIAGVASADYGGTLVISNITMDATPLMVGDTFTLFSASTSGGNFNSIVGSPGTGLAYSFNPSSGVLSVVNAATSNPTNITFSVNGGNLSLSWPSDHLGWFLQTQTNNLNTGLSASWFDIPGSDAITSTNIVVSTTTPTVFFRLRSP